MRLQWTNACFFTMVRIRKGAILKTKQIIWSYRIIVIAIFLVILYRDPALGNTTLCSFWVKARLTIGLWMARGWSSFAATEISTAIGNFADFNWWIIVFYDFDLWPRTRRIMAVFWKFSPAEAEFQNWKYRLRYIAIPLISCLLPSGGVWTALIIARFLRLNKWATLALVLIGNTVRGNFWGGVFAILRTTFLGRNMGLATVAILIFFIACSGLVKILRKLHGRKKVQQDNTFFPRLGFHPQELIALCCARALLY